MRSYTLTECLNAQKIKTIKVFSAKNPHVTYIEFDKKRVLLGDPKQVHSTVKAHLGIELQTTTTGCT